MVAPKEVIYTGGITDAKYFINDCFIIFLAVSMYIAYQKEKSRNKKD